MHGAIVTGVSRGLGEALAAELLRRGAIVVGVGRSASARHRNERYRHVSCDLAHPALVAAAVLPALRDLALDKPSAVKLVKHAAEAMSVGLLGRFALAESETVNAAKCDVEVGVV